jgi:enoyl-CoA hydratase/carnithine racemase
MSESSARVEVRDGTLRLTFQRPEKLNAIDREMEDALRSCAGELESRDDVRVLLIRATGRYFSAGFDVSGRVANMTKLEGSAYRRAYREMHDLFDALERSEKPSVVALQGPCLGGALELALSCDFRIAADAASFRFPELELGVVPGSGGISRLVRLVGPGWARWLALGGQPLTAREALAIGLVHEVVPDGELEERVDLLVGHLASLPRDAVGLAKLAIDTCERLDRGSARDVERIVNSLLVPSEEHAARLAKLRSDRRGVKDGG